MTTEFKPTGESVRISVVSHDEELLNNVPTREFLHKVLLSDLRLPQHLMGEKLAENRYLVTNDLLANEYNYRGFVSARWNQRFTDWPKLENLDILFALLEVDAESRIFFGPSTYRIKRKQVRSWLRAQGKVHPGMQELLEELISFKSMSFEPRKKYSVVMGNNFIVSDAVARDFLDFWQSCFDHIYGLYGFDLPFIYRCQKCGFQSEEGVDRWANLRHPGFLFERVSSLFFLSRPDLVPFQYRRGKLLELKKTKYTNAFGFGLMASTLWSFVKTRGNPCKTNHVS
jgi:hypothetical protein